MYIVYYITACPCKTKFKQFETYPVTFRKQFNIVRIVSDDNGVCLDEFSSLADDPAN